MLRAEPFPTATAPWPERKRRATALLGRYPFAAELLRLYRALLDVQERAFDAGVVDRPDPRDVPHYVAERVLPSVVEVTAAHGPRRLGEMARERLLGGDLDHVVGRWLRGEDDPAGDRYLARASSAPVLEAMGPAAGRACGGPRDERHCPICGGLPQVGLVAASGDDLLTAPLELLCSRCSHAWRFPRLTCAGCGETTAGQLVVHAESERFPHLRVDACETCLRYLVIVDCRKDPAAIPIVDELVALPLDLYLQERGLTKITANLMGIG